MKKTKVLIVDDEVESQNNLKYLIENHFSELEITGIASSVAEAKELISVNEPDIVYLDVMMPGMDGFSLLRLFPNRNFEVIVTTASSEFGIQGIKHGAIDYILKPATIDDLSSSINVYKNLGGRAPALLTTNKPFKIAIPTKDGFQLENLTNILRFTADNNYTMVHIFNKNPILVSKTLVSFEQKLVNVDSFFRINKSHLINMEFIVHFTISDGGSVKMIDGSYFPISKKKNPEFFDALSQVSFMPKP
jgi:two-component system, LytTR family, response regulator